MAPAGRLAAAWRAEAVPRALPAGQQAERRQPAAPAGRPCLDAVRQEPVAAQRVAAAGSIGRRGHERLPRDARVE